MYEECLQHQCSNCGLNFTDFTKKTSTLTTSDLDRVSIFEAISFVYGIGENELITKISNYVRSTIAADSDEYIISSFDIENENIFDSSNPPEIMLCVSCSSLMSKLYEFHKSFGNLTNKLSLFSTIVERSIEMVDVEVKQECSTEKSEKEDIFINDSDSRENVVSSCEASVKETSILSNWILKDSIIPTQSNFTHSEESSSKVPILKYEEPETITLDDDEPNPDYTIPTHFPPYKATTKTRHSRSRRTNRNVSYDEVNLDNSSDEYCPSEESDTSDEDYADTRVHDSPAKRPKTVPQLSQIKTAVKTAADLVVSRNPIKSHLRPILPKGPIPNASLNEMLKIPVPMKDGKPIPGQRTLIIVQGPLALIDPAATSQTEDDIEKTGATFNRAVPTSSDDVVLQNDYSPDSPIKLDSRKSVEKPSTRNRRRPFDKRGE